MAFIGPDESLPQEPLQMIVVTSICMPLLSCCVSAIVFGTQRRNNGPKTLLIQCSAKPTVVPTEGLFKQTSFTLHFN